MLSQCLQQASGVEHADDFRDDLELVLRNVQPQVECVNHLSSNLLSWDGVDVGERLQDGLYLRTKHWIWGECETEGWTHRFIAFRPCIRRG